MLRLVLIFVSFCVLGQTNLVLNGSMEEYSACPSDFVKQGEALRCKHWTSATVGTPDYFNVCSNLAGVPTNFAGFRPAFSGKGYCGLIAYQGNSNEREYLEGVLSKPLEAGKQYRFSMKVALSTGSVYSTSELCVLFADTLVKLKSRTPTMEVNGVATFKVLQFQTYEVKNHFQWETLDTTFTAKGGEKAIIIGNYAPPSKAKLSEDPDRVNLPANSAIGKAAYYYIDMVSIYEVNATEEKFKEKSYFVAHGIYFDSDKYKLQDSSTVYLNKLVEYLLEHPEKKVRIEGHTDDQGTVEHNQILSRKRAEEVMKYLVSKGVPAKNLSAKGWGSSKPVSKDANERYKNRRIEMYLE